MGFKRVQTGSQHSERTRQSCMAFYDLHGRIIGTGPLRKRETVQCGGLPPMADEVLDKSLRSVARSDQEGLSIPS